MAAATNPDQNAGTTSVAPRAAVIVNPSKFDGAAALEDFKQAVDVPLSDHGFTDTLWLETTEDDPGHEMAATARSEAVDLVIAAGGDGTVRVVAGGLAGSEIPMGILPMGTANLLARNLNLPTNRDKAMAVVIGGQDRRIDLVSVTADDGEPERFAVMAGVGADAVVMEGANPKLKKVLGSAAYFFSAAQNADHPPLRATITIDDEEPFHRESILLLIGNVGYLQAGVPLIPSATPDDGRLDLLVASPQSKPGRLKLLTEVLFRRHHLDDDFDLRTGKKVTIEVAEPEAFELDGDPVGHCRRLTAEVEPGTLLIRVVDPDE